MSFEFQSTLVNVTPSYRISGSQIGGVRIENNGGIRVARVIVTNDADVKFALSGPYESGDPDAIYATLSADLYELAPGVLLNEGAVGSVEIESDKIVIDLEGSDRKFTFMPDAVVTEATEVADHTWKLTTAGFAALGTAAAAWRSSMDGTLEGLSTAVATEVADRIAAINGVQADVDQNEADADAAIAAEASTREANDNLIIASVANEASTREAADTALSDRVDVLEADPTTAAAVAAGDAATLSSANTYTDTSITNLVNGADAALDTLKEIGDALSQGDSDVTAALTAQITTESTARSTADAALSGRLDTLEADPTTQAALDAEVTARTTADSALDGRVTTLEGNVAITDPTTATAVAAVQSDVDANEVASDAADAALSGRLDVLEADPTTAAAVAAVQADVDQNESDSDAADAALSGRLDVLEADPTTATAVAAVQADVDQNEADADAALALRALLDGSNIPGPYANDAAAATAGIAVGAIYKHDNGQLHYRVS